MAHDCDLTPDPETYPFHPLFLDSGVPGRPGFLVSRDPTPVPWGRKPTQGPGAGAFVVRTPRRWRPVVAGPDGPVFR